MLRAGVRRVALPLSVGAAALLRVAAIFRYRIDSDEPQHLHVVWGWTHGLLQYRDVFDNHMPLFQILCAPLLRGIGERPETLIYMRLAMLPLYAAAIALTWRIASSCYPRRLATWSTIAAALVPGFLLCSTEFRTDDLWTVFWLASVALLVRTTHPRVLQIVLAGLALGLAAAVSAKTILLLLAVAAGALAVLIESRQWKRIGWAAAFLAGFVIPPAAVALYFHARGAWDPFIYGALTHNIVGHERIGRIVAFPCFLLAIGTVGHKVPDLRRRFLFITTHFYAAVLFSFWPLVEHEHWMPYYPLAAITILPLLTKRVRVIFAVISVEIALVLASGQLWRNETADGLAVIRQTLLLTKPGETVMDLKGETVFRKRAFFYVLEPMTKWRMHRGLIANTIVADVLRTHTMVVGPDHYGFMRPARAFLARNFVSVGAVRVAGQILKPGQIAFTIEVPAEYAVLREGEAYQGLLDGRRYDGPRFLAAGMHRVDPGEGGVALLWARAAALGMTPAGSTQTFGQCHRKKGSRRSYAQTLGHRLFGFGPDGARRRERQTRAQDGLTGCRGDAFHQHS